MNKKEIIKGIQRNFRTFGGGYTTSGNPVT